MENYDVLLVNLETGQTISADSYRLREIGIPEGYRQASEITTDEWVKALRVALGWNLKDMFGEE